jgi:hypothetical protein
MHLNHYLAVAIIGLIIPTALVQPFALAQTPTLVPTLVSRTTGVDYTPLRQLLQAGEWKQADKKTIGLMLVAANRVDKGWLDKDSLEHFSCEDLRIIDREWADASNGKFGFAAQKQVWEEVGSPREWDDSTARQWHRMYIKLRWKDNGADYGRHFKSYNELYFNNSQGWLGHLPVVGHIVGGHRSSLNGVTVIRGNLFSRVADCNL